ncbi:unnamed protein product [Caenorhabditis nigoni]
MQLKFLNRTDSYGNVKGVPCFVILDGKHWKTDHPPKTGSLNYNYKGFYSFNSLFLSDADTRIVYLQISKLGVNSDAQLYRNGPLDGLLKAAAATAGMLTLPGSHHVMPAFCLADNGFGLTKQMMTPYRANQLASNGHISNLTLLDVANNEIKTFKGVEELEALNDFWANDNKVEPFSEVDLLSKLKDLQTVYLERNPFYFHDTNQYRRKVMLTLTQITQLDATMCRQPTSS